MITSASFVNDNFTVDFRKDYEEKIGTDFVQFCRDWEYGFTFQHGDFQPSDIILDIGGACSYFLLYISDHIKQGFIVDDASTSSTWYDDWYKSLFLFEAFIKGKIIVIKQNAASLPFRDCFFDKIVTISALEHFVGEDDIATSLEAYRCLKPGGCFLGTVDFNPVYEYPRLEYLDERVYTYESFWDRIIYSAGFKLFGDAQYVDKNLDWKEKRDFFFFKVVK